MGRSQRAYNERKMENRLVICNCSKIPLSVIMCHLSAYGEALNFDQNVRTHLNENILGASCAERKELSINNCVSVLSSAQSFVCQLRG
jgi:hypothetical protein